MEVLIFNLKMIYKEDMTKSTVNSGGKTRQNIAYLNSYVLN